MILELLSGVPLRSRAEGREDSDHLRHGSCRVAKAAYEAIASSIGGGDSSDMLLRIESWLTQ